MTLPTPTFSAAQRRAAATALGSLIGDNAAPDWGNVVAGSPTATRINNACRIARSCATQQSKIGAVKPLTPG